MRSTNQKRQKDLEQKKNDLVGSIKNAQDLHAWAANKEKENKELSKTNDDLVKEARLEEDYTAEISFEGMREGQNIIEFSLVPKIDAAVVWGKLKLIVLADSNIPLVEYYYDEDFELARTIWFSDIQLLAGRQRPAVLTVIPADKPEELTQFIYKHLSLNVELNDSLFSLSSLKKR